MLFQNLETEKRPVTAEVNKSKPLIASHLYKNMAGHYHKKIVRFE